MEGNFGLYFSLPILSWAVYDFTANTIFSSLISIRFSFHSSSRNRLGKNAVLDRLRESFISYANAIASLFLVLFSPLFGVMIDRTGKNEKIHYDFHTHFCCMYIFNGVFGGRCWMERFWAFRFLGDRHSFICIIKFFYHSSLVFYDTMMSDLGTKQQLPLISGFGVAVGYLGTVSGTVHLSIHR